MNMDRPGHGKTSCSPPPTQGACGAPGGRGGAPLTPDDDLDPNMDSLKNLYCRYDGTAEYSCSFANISRSYTRVVHTLFHTEGKKMSTD